MGVNIYGSAKKEKKPGEGQRRLGDKARVEEEKPESRRIFGLDLEEIVVATAREHGKGVEELKRRRRGGENEARMVAIYLGRQLGGHKHEEIGKTVGLGKTSSVSSAYLLMKKRMFKEKELVRRAEFGGLNNYSQTAKSRLDPFTSLWLCPRYMTGWQWNISGLMSFAVDQTR